MKRKALLFVLIFSVILIMFAGCKNSNTEIQKNADQKENAITEYNSYVLKWDNYGTWEEDIDKVIISNMDELQKFCDKLENEDESYAIVDRIYRSAELFKDYDEEYFKNKSLAILGVDLGNGSLYIDSIKATKENNSVKIDYKISHSNETGTTDMRKQYIVVEIDKDITDIERNCMTLEYSYTDVSLSIKSDTLTSKGATFIIKNNSKEDYTYGAEYRIQVKKDGQWQDMELNQPIAWNSMAYSLNSRGQREINIDFTYGYGELSNGQYRLVKDDLRKSVSHDSRAYSVYAEFEIL
ncbi:MAG: hypothetical protein IJ890_03400 [Clostridia bacterium]|nr:hypothetical protein [Clostridia bacterium]